LAVRRKLDKQIAFFLREKRGDLSSGKFARKIGLSRETIRRVEIGEHHLTFYKFESVLSRLNLRLKDVFPDEF
jgi:transcriptional regulator with XRE-family HTH domain